MEIHEHKLSFDELRVLYDVSFDAEQPASSVGLTTAVASQRLAVDGPNVLAAKKVKAAYRLFLECMFSLFNIMLLLCSMLSLVAAFVLGRETEATEGTTGFTDPDFYLAMGLLSLVLINSFIEFSQLQKSSTLLSSFMNMAPAKCSVIRNSQLQLMGVCDLVRGDLVFMRQGDKVPADVVLVNSKEFKVDNSSLTGEAEPQKRYPGPVEENNQVEATNVAFSTSLVLEGEAYGIVMHTGSNTVIGQIANMTQDENKRESPLQSEIRGFVQLIFFVAGIVAVVIFVTAVCLNINKYPENIKNGVRLAIGVLVAWVPQGLPLTVTILLQRASKRMLAQNVVVKNLAGVETLGAITLLATDKTGTLTRNQMTVGSFWTHLMSFSSDTFKKERAEVTRTKSMTVSHHEEISTSHYHTVHGYTVQEWLKENTEKIPEGIRDIVNISALCSSVRFDNMDLPPEQRVMFGDPTESGLMRMALSHVNDYDKLCKDVPKVFEIPFNSSTKWHLSIHKMDHKSGQLVAFMKGAPERVLKACNQILTNKGATSITAEHREQFTSTYESMAGKGHRVIAFAKLEMSSDEYPLDFEFNPTSVPVTGFTFSGLVSLEDPPKHGVREAIGKCRCAGIKVVMVTGDHPLTAESVARKINLMTSETLEQVVKRTGIPIEQISPDEINAVVIHGDKVATMNDDEWDSVFMKDEIIFARTSPKDKLIIVKKAQARGHIVGVTGDGVNDSPALKKSDLGIAMHMSGSDVSKEAATMILLDDNFASVVSAICEGRLIFSNMKKSIQYILSHIIPEFLPIVASLIFSIPSAIGPMQVIIIDLFFEFAASLSFAYEKPENEFLMKLPPRRPVTFSTIENIREKAAFFNSFKKGQNILEDTLVAPNLTLLERIKVYLTPAYWRLGIYLTPEEKGQKLVDVSLLSYSYLFAGILEFIGAAFWYSLIINSMKSTTTFWVYLKTLTEDSNEARMASTGYFLGILIIQVFNMFACKCRLRHPFTKYILQNRVTWIAIGIGMAIACFFIYVPRLNDIFGCSAPNYTFIFVPILFGLMLFLFTGIGFIVKRAVNPLKFAREPIGLQMHPTRWSRV